MFNFDYITIWPEIPDHLCWILVAGDSGSEKANALFNLINHEPYIDKIYLYAEDPHELNYREESTDLEYLNDSKTFIKYWNDMNDIYKNIE